MNQRRILTGFLTAALQKYHGVAIWFLPGKSEIQAILCEADEIKTPGSFSEVSKDTGFVFAPFRQCKDHQILFLKSKEPLKGFEALTRFQSDRDYFMEKDLSGNCKETTKELHISNCREIIRQIKRGDAEKVVLSRIKPVTIQKHPADILLQMKTEYPQSFCYLFYTSQSGLWMGATPETLIHEQAGKTETMALAGTRKHAPEKPADRPWPIKEQEEQKYVTDFIKKKLYNLGIRRINISSPYTVQTGSIEHIRTDFVVDTKGISANTGKITDALHPTPAVCGQPKESALQIIYETETHSREYYTGFLGPVNYQGETSIFVNLRCMKAMGNSFQLFAGGGITAESDPAAEWEETEMKAAVMEKVLKQV
jgi:isochorismate synthase